MILFRLSDFLNRYFVTRIFSAILVKANTFLCGAVIGRGASFDKNFVILHSVGVVINSRVKGGRDIVIESGVVIGEEKSKCPMLGSNIFIGSGAKIFGDITIGDNVTIGANAVVNKSIPSDVVVAGVPAAVVRHKSTGPKTDEC
ncbi:MAG: serine acetyltransferase [Desulfobacteraceae bacterium]|nr:MAG: serine acetyltransferase [Desulfobacteraceae bacterium]